MILWLLGNEMIQSNTRVKKSEPGLRNQVKIDVKSIYVTYLYIFTNIRCFRFQYFIFQASANFKCLRNNVFIRWHFI